MPYLKLFYLKGVLTAPDLKITLLHTVKWTTSWDLRANEKDIRGEKCSEVFCCFLQAPCNQREGSSIYLCRLAWVRQRTQSG